MWPMMAAAAATFSGFMYYAAGVPSSQVFGPSLVRARGASGRVALTLDDGPSESTPAFLDILAEFGARATFFQVGANAQRLPEVARRVAADGHEIGNHTEKHPRFYLCTPGEIASEIESCQRSLEAVHGRRPTLFRPPFGARWFGMYPALRRAGLKSVMWSVSGRDWERRSDWVAQQVITMAETEGFPAHAESVRLRCSDLAEQEHP